MKLRILILTLIFSASCAGTTLATILNTSQPLADGTAFVNTNYVWQSITVNSASDLTVFGFLLSSFGLDTSLTATIELLSGVGTGGTTLSIVTGSVITASGAKYLKADFGNISLSAGQQYTVYVHDFTAAPPDFMRQSGNPYSGGTFDSGYGNLGWDATFYTPIPGYVVSGGGGGSGGGSGGASSVPEPGTMMLMGSGVLGMLGFRRRELLAYIKRV